MAILKSCVHQFKVSMAFQSHLQPWKWTCESHVTKCMPSQTTHLLTCHLKLSVTFSLAGCLVWCNSPAPTHLECPASARMVGAVWSEPRGLSGIMRSIAPSTAYVLVNPFNITTLWDLHQYPNHHLPSTVDPTLIIWLCFPYSGQRGRPLHFLTKSFRAKHFKKVINATTVVNIDPVVCSVLQKIEMVSLYQ